MIGSWARWWLSTVLLLAFGTTAAQAQTYTVLYAFSGPDGAGPDAGVIADSTGSLFGTTEGGGALGYGTVFKLGEAGETVLHSFTGSPDGAYPYAGLISNSAGDLFGTTGNGGAQGYGTAFKVDASGNETLLHSFTDLKKSGEIPGGGLVLDGAENLYGTTSAGVLGYGNVFKLNASGEEQALHVFTGGADGGVPFAGLIHDSAGNLYGTTAFGGIIPGYSGNGVLFKLDASSKETTVLYSFTGGADGGNPIAGLIQDSAGNLYGTTSSGGVAPVPAGYGVVFKLDPAGALTVLHTFTGGADGAYPGAGLTLDSDGNLYGTAEQGGIGQGALGYGVVFKLDTTGTETVLYTFTGGADGGQPRSVLLRDSAGNLYGTAGMGGIANGPDYPYGCGVVFKIAP
jgi:uncharacterized repeat protein (TIGR03803 family)